MGAFRFYSPYWFVLLPVALLALWRAHSSRYAAAAVFSSISDLRSLPVTVAQRIRRTMPWFYGCGVVLLILALARPQQGTSESLINSEGIAIEMVIDKSGSMEAVDYELNGKSVNRINAVKHVFREFVAGSKESGLPGRPNDMVGLIAFGTYADSKCPVTLDHGALLDMLNSVDVTKLIYDRHGNPINMKIKQEEDETAIGDGLTLALDRLKAVDAKSKVVILLTDGDNNAGIVDPHDAALAAKAMGVRVYTIGVGHNGPVPFPQDDGFGNVHLVSVEFPIDEDLLKFMASTTGGKYWHASDVKALTDVYAEIDSLEKSKVEQLTFMEYRELYPWLLIPGLALLFGVNVLGATRFRTLP
jgi:Ca-activated chloride channel family protein